MAPQSERRGGVPYVREYTAPWVLAGDCIVWLVWLTLSLFSLSLCLLEWFCRVWKGLCLRFWMSSWVSSCGGFPFSRLANKFSGSSKEGAPSHRPAEGSNPVPSANSARISKEKSQRNEGASADILRRREEGLENYKPGGYHPVEIAEVYSNRYRIVKKLGWGHFSTVWLVEDLSWSNWASVGIQKPKHLAMKVQKSGSAYREAAVDEIQLLKTAASSECEGARYVVRLVDHFRVSGPNGIHYCMVFELLGDNLLSLLRFYASVPPLSDVFEKTEKGIPLPLVKIIVKDVLLGLDYLHRNCNIIHTDLKPENVLLNHPIRKISHILNPSSHPGKTQGLKYSSLFSQYQFKDGIAKVVDLGNGCWTHKHFTEYITTRQYRSPEAIVEYSYGTPVDIWSLACITFELITGEYLFEPKADDKGRYTRDEDHLALMIELLGPAPEVIRRKGKCSPNFFSKNGSLRRIPELPQWSLQSLLFEKYNIPKDTASELESFLLPMLQMDPNCRHSAWMCLQHPWLSSVYQNSSLSIGSHVPVDEYRSQATYFLSKDYVSQNGYLSNILAEPAKGIPETGFSPVEISMAPSMNLQHGSHSEPGPFIQTETSSVSTGFPQTSGSTAWP